MTNVHALQRYRIGGLNRELRPTPDDYEPTVWDLPDSLIQALSGFSDEELLDAVGCLSLECQLYLAELPDTPSNLRIKDAVSQRTRWQVVAAYMSTTPQPVLRHLLFTGEERTSSSYLPAVPEAAAWAIEDLEVLVEAFLLRRELRGLLPVVIREQWDGTSREPSEEESARRDAIAEMLEAVVEPCLDESLDHVDYAPLARFICSSPEVATLAASGDIHLLAKIASWQREVWLERGRLLPPDEVERMIRWFAGLSELERQAAARLAGAVKAVTFDDLDEAVRSLI